MFTYNCKGQMKSWTHNTFVARLRELLTRCGFEAGDFSGHSFRRGGATLAFKLGMTITEIKKRGDWLSNAVEEYVCLDYDQERHMAAALVSGAEFLKSR